MSATLDRIRKLMAVAACDGATTDEADTARAIAERLMSAAGISEADLADAGQAALDADVASVAAERGGSADVRWEAIVCAAVARVVGCVYYREGGGYGPTGRLRRRAVWVGTASQRETARALVEHVTDQIERLAANVRRRLAGRRDLRSYLHAYRMGVASAIAETARALRAAHVAAPTTSSALVHRDRVAAAIAAITPPLGTSRRVAVRGDAYGAGRVDGSTIALQRSVPGAGVRRLGAGS